MLPNPTSDHWLKNAKSKSSWEMTRCMEVFLEHLKDLAPSTSHPAIQTILADSVKLAQLSGKRDGDLTLDQRETIHDIVDSQTQFLLSVPQAEVFKIVAAHVAEVITLLSNSNSPLNSSSLANKERTLIQQYFKEIRPRVSRAAELSSTSSETDLKEASERDAIWISLIFRMLCWLLLHDFDKSDIMIVPSDLRGSRMPIYIG